MSNIFKPHIEKASVIKQSMVLENGEMIIELSDGSTINGKMKIGDGVSTYENLPYVVGVNGGDISDNFTTFTENTSSAPLDNAISNNPLKAIIADLKSYLNTKQ